MLGLPGVKMHTEAAKIDVEKYDSWVKKGAQPTETVKSLAKRHRKSLKKSAASE